MKKIFIALASILFVLSTSAVLVHADTATYHDSEQVGFTGVYTPPETGNPGGSHPTGSLPGNELAYVPGGSIPNAGDSSNFVYLLIAGSSVTAAAILVWKFQKNKRMLA